MNFKNLVGATLISSALLLVTNVYAEDPIVEHIEHHVEKAIVHAILDDHHEHHPEPTKVIVVERPVHPVHYQTQTRVRPHHPYYQHHHDFHHDEHHDIHRDEHHDDHR